MTYMSWTSKLHDLSTKSILRYGVDTQSPLSNHSAASNSYAAPGNSHHFATFQAYLSAILKGLPNMIRERDMRYVEASPHIQAFCHLYQDIVGDCLA